MFRKTLMMALTLGAVAAFALPKGMVVRHQSSALVLAGTLKADSVQRYIDLHNNIPDAIIRNLELGGIYDCRMFLSDDRRVVLYATIGKPSPRYDELFDQAAEDAWQAATGPSREGYVDANADGWHYCEKFFDQKDH